MNIKYFLFTCLVLTVLQLPAQVRNEFIGELDTLLQEKKYTLADEIVKNRIDYYWKQKNIDSLKFYAKYIGEIGYQLRGARKTNIYFFSILHKAQELTPYNPELVELVLELSDFLSNSQNDQEAYKITDEINSYFSRHQQIIEDRLSTLQSNLGVYALRVGMLEKAADHFRKSIYYQQRQKKQDPEGLYFGNNNMGICMLMSTKYDSSLVYFKAAINALHNMDSTPLNRNYRVALVTNNMSIAFSNLGRVKESIDAYEQVIEHYKKFLASPDPDTRKENAKKSQYQTIDNLASVYIDMGDHSKAHSLLYYSYQEKLKNFGPESPEVYKSMIFLGTSFYNTFDYKSAIRFLTDALQKVKQSGALNTSWEADASAMLGACYWKLKDSVKAVQHYNDASRIYAIVFANGFHPTYSQHITQEAEFYADQGNAEKALAIAEKGIRYVIKGAGENSLLATKQALTQANVHYKLKYYEKAIYYANKCLTIFDHLIQTSTNRLDSIRIETERPLAILIKAKSEYALMKKKQAGDIQRLLKELEQASTIIESSKLVLTDEKAINVLIYYHKDLSDFINKLQLDLYDNTGNKAYLNTIIDLHESAIYSRIRSRFDKQKSISFSKIPANVIAREDSLKKRINQALSGSRSATESISLYIKSLKDWNDFQLEIKKNYPAYHSMRYGSTKGFTMEQLARNIPDKVTVVRYFFIDDALFSLIADNKNQQWIRLDNTGINDMIMAMADVSSELPELFSLSPALYDKLWRPLSPFIKNKRVVIVPDGILYNLSFEMLSSRKINSYKELVQFSILQQHAISYHYSLLTISSPQKTKEKVQQLVAFAPGFSDDVKNSYKQALRQDSFKIDNNYLSLLPLPFSVNLAKETQKKFLSSLYLNQTSTQENFRTNAGNHSIIHIGTHAESNNQYPEYSRLIFAKDLTNPTRDNSLYLFDIYNYDLRSDLTVLTACETGKPGFFPGEGMISMAHAFNYAGSESILTGLWKIDEQASTIITQFFYDKLAEGMTKDEALRQAKLSYLATAEGRMLAPQYWAGLVIMGDTTPIEIKQQNWLKKNWWLLGLFIISGIAVAWWYKKRNHKAIA